MLQMTKDRFDALGCHTASISILTLTFVATVEPENVKAVLASDFRSYGLPEGRKRLLRPVLGEGIFTTDGKEWVLSFLSVMNTSPYLRWFMIATYADGVRFFLCA